MKTFVLVVYLLVWWHVVVTLSPTLAAFDDWAIGRQAVAIVVATEWAW